MVPDIEWIETLVTLVRQDTGFGFRIVGGTEEGSQVSGRIVNAPRLRGIEGIDNAFVSRYQLGISYLAAQLIWITG